MRRAVSVVLGLLLTIGSTLTGPGHVHAASHPGASGGVHYDHVHFDSHHDADHSHRVTGPASEFTADHAGADAVQLAWVISEATPKRLSCHLAAPSARSDAPATPSATTHVRPDPAPRDPPPRLRPPDRAPPART